MRMSRRRRRSTIDDEVGLAARGVYSYTSENNFTGGSWSQAASYEQFMQLPPDVTPH
jgi:hypothetical protein